MKSGVLKFSLMFLSVLATGSAHAAIAGASEVPDFRTPAKRYGAAYSVKATLVRQGFTFVIPMWIRPDQKESTLDPGQLRYMGWNLNDMQADQMSLSGENLGRVRFKAARSDWAVKPEYPKNCCMGVIGQDLLSRFRLRFDPATPVHVEWERVAVKNAKEEKSGGHPGSQDFESLLRPLFSVTNEVVRVGKSQYDLATTPFVLNVSAGELQFERGPFTSRKEKPAPMFSFEFIGPERDLDVRSLRVPSQGAAKSAGFGSGVRVKELNGIPVANLTRYEIEGLLRGKKGKTLEIGFLKENPKQEKSSLIFDFEKNEFTPSGSFQGRPGRK